jgi:hypothetical protein
MLKVPKGSTVNAIGSAREDDLDLIDYLLLNPDWPITPCVVISLYGCPYVLVCRDHPKGNKLDYIHPRLSPNGMLKCTCHCCTENHITDESKGVFDNISNA